MHRDYACLKTMTLNWRGSYARRSAEILKANWKSLDPRLRILNRSQPER